MMVNRSTLFLETGAKVFDRFQLRYKFSAYDQVGSKAYVPVLDPVILSRDVYLALNGDSKFSQLMQKSCFINRFQKSRPERFMNFHTKINDYLCFFIFCSFPP